MIAKKASAAVLAGAVLLSSAPYTIGDTAQASPQYELPRREKPWSKKSSLEAPLAQATQDSAIDECPQTALEDGDGDFERNKPMLTADLCIRQVVFVEGGLRWVLHIIEKIGNSRSVLWVIPHDDENAAFDAGLYAVKKYGGTLIAVHTNGKRNNGKQDPNRNFNSVGGKKCKEQLAPSPNYTANFMKFWSLGMPIIALHTNMGGDSLISILKPQANAAIAFPSPTPLPAKSSNNTLVYVASTLLPEQDSVLLGFVKKLNQQGIHVLYELVSGNNNCSLSHYTALQGIKNYINIEVEDGDLPTQKVMIDRILKISPKVVNPQ